MYTLTAKQALNNPDFLRALEYQEIIVTLMDVTQTHELDVVWIKPGAYVFITIVHSDGMSDVPSDTLLMVNPNNASMTHSGWRDDALMKLV